MKNPKSYSWAALLLFILLFLVLTVTSEGDEKWRSPNGQLECFTQLGRDKRGQELWIRWTGQKEKGQLVWGSPHWMEAAWSPDLRFLAVTDHDEDRRSAVLVFGITVDSVKKFIEPVLLYQTPVDGKTDVEWDVAGWNLKKREIFLKRKEKSETVTASVPIGDQPVQQTLYSRDPRGPKKNEIKVK